MLHHALIKLVENVRGNPQVDIRVGKFLPEWSNDGLDPSFGAGGTVSSRVHFKRGQRLQDFGKVSVFVVFLEVAQPLPLRRTSGTISSFAPGDKDLLWVVSNETCKYGKGPTHYAITTGHLDGASLIEGLQRLKHAGKTIMKEVGKHSAA